MIKQIKNTIYQINKSSNKYIYKYILKKNYILFYQINKKNQNKLKIKLKNKKELLNLIQKIKNNYN